MSVLFFAAELVLWGSISACAAHPIGPQGIQAMAHDKAHRTPAQQKLDSHIYAAARTARETTTESGTGSLATRENGLELDGHGNVHVDIQAVVNPRLEADIVASGGTVQASFPTYGTIRAWIPLSVAEALASRSDVTFIAPAARGTTNFGND